LRATRVDGKLHFETVNASRASRRRRSNFSEFGSGGAIGSRGSTTARGFPSC
jgi:hypothetical protein